MAEPRSTRSSPSGKRQKSSPEEAQSGTEDPAPLADLLKKRTPSTLIKNASVQGRAAHGVAVTGHGRGKQLERAAPEAGRHSCAAPALAFHVPRGVGRRAHRGGRARLRVLASVEPEQDVGGAARRTPAEPRSRAVGARGQCFIPGEIISQSRVRNLPAAALSSRVFLLLEFVAW